MSESNFITHVRAEGDDADGPLGAFTGLYVIATPAFPLGEWFFIGNDGVPHSLKGDSGAPVVVIGIDDLNDPAQVIAALGLVAGTNSGEAFTVVDNADQSSDYKWFSDIRTPDSAFVVAGSSGTFLGVGPRWIATQAESNANINSFRNFYLTPALRDANIIPADWHGIMPMHTHLDNFSNVVGQFWSVHNAQFVEFLTTSNHSGAIETSLRSGGILTIAGDPTKFTISAGRGFVVDFTDPSGIVDIQEVTWSEFTDQTVDASDNFTSVGLSYNPVTGVVSVEKELGALFTPQEHRLFIVLGSVNHSAGLNILSVDGNPHPSYNFGHGIMDYIRALGGKTIGLDVLLSNSNLTWATAAGSFILPFVNADSDTLSPSIIPHPAENPLPAGFNYILADGTGNPPTSWIPINTNAIDPNSYEIFSGTEEPVPAGKWTIQVDFRLGQQNFHVLQFGQTLFDTKEDAIAAVNTYKDTFVRNPILVALEIAGYFILQQGATNLQDIATAEYIIPADKESVITPTSIASLLPGTKAQFNSKITDGDFQFIDDLGTSDIDLFSAEKIIADFQAVSEQGSANGYPDLDGSALVPLSQLPDSVKTGSEYKGAWNATTNIPVIINGTGSNGDYYRVSVAGTQDFGAGDITFLIGDIVVYNGTTSIWQRIAGNPDLVQSVNGEQGVVVLELDDLANAGGFVKMTDAERTKLTGIEALAEVNNISDIDATDLTDSGETTLHTHPLQASSIINKIKEFDTSRANNNTPSADPDLSSIPLAINTDYMVRAAIYAQCNSATPDIRVGFTIPAGASMAIGMTGSRAGASAAQFGAKFETSGQTQNVAIVGGGISIIMLEGIIRMGGTAGNLDLIWSQNTSNATSTVLEALSYLEIDPRS